MMILLGLMSIWTLFEVIFREAGVSVPWLEEFTIYAFSWLTYFGAANVLRNDGHLSVTAITGIIEKKSPKARKALAIITYIIVAVFCCIVCGLIEIRVTGYFRITFSFSFVILSGRPASTVNSCTVSIEKLCSIHESRRSNCPADNVVGVPPPI